MRPKYDLRLNERLEVALPLTRLCRAESVKHYDQHIRSQFNRLIMLRLFLRQEFGVCPYATWSECVRGHDRSGATASEAGGRTAMSFSRIEVVHALRVVFLRRIVGAVHGRIARLAAGHCKRRHSTACMALIDSQGG